MSQTPNLNEVARVCGAPGLPKARASHKSLTLPEVGFVREPVVLAHVGFGRTKWREMVAAGQAPAPRRLGPRCTMYDAALVRAWIAERANSAPVVQFQPRKPRATAPAAEARELAAA